jgi:hypothetical protein
MRLGPRADRSERASLVVAREPETARVVVEQLGFTQARLSGGATHVAYGLELVNSSYEHDALDVGIAVRFFGAHGRSLALDSLRLTGISAATTFYVGGRVRVASKRDVRRLSATVTVRASQESRLFLPVAADIGMGRDRFGRLRVAGKVTAYTKRVSKAARIYAVIFDGKGSVIGGGTATIASATGAEVAPGQTAAFVLEDFSPTPARGALFAGVSIDP